MPKARTGKELNEADVAAVMRQIQKDFNVEHLCLDISVTPSYPFKVFARCSLIEEDCKSFHASFDFYTTDRYPNINLPMWKAAQSLYSTLQRYLDGLTPLL